MLSPKTPEKIHHEISDMLSKGVSYIDALIEYAKRNNRHRAIDTKDLIPPTIFVVGTRESIGRAKEILNCIDFIDA
jgi:hypothetical protein